MKGPAIRGYSGRIEVGGQFGSHARGSRPRRLRGLHPHASKPRAAAFAIAGRAIQE
jgi:hypothetical protein